MARWEPRTPKENLQASLERLKKRIQGKQSEVKDLEAQARQVEEALKALK
jgi:predicted  nucleic acid-binding Zn-ribbon protein